MPTRERLVEARDGREVEQPVERTVKERPESDEDLGPFLGQIIRLPDNPVDEFLSPGDIVIAVGMVVVFVAGGRRRPRASDDVATDETEDQEEEVAMAAPTMTPQPPPVPEPPPTPEPPPVPAPPPQPEPPPEPAPPPEPEPPAAPEPARVASRTAADEWEEWRAELRELAGDVDLDEEDGNGDAAA